jgi:hypothetical protein
MTPPGGAAPLLEQPCGPASLAARANLAVRARVKDGSSRGFTGQGPAGFRRPAPLTAIPRGESFAPTRSARTPLVVGAWRRRLESRRRRERTPVQEARITAPVTNPPREPAFAMPATTPRTTRSRGAAGPEKSHLRRIHRRGWVACADAIRGQGPPHPILREENRDPLHPRCLSSMGCPIGAGPSPQLVSNLWKTSGAFAILALPYRP